jgi:hypothetical protein
MAWNGVHLFVTGELFTATIGNTYLSDNLQHLYDNQCVLQMVQGTYATEVSSSSSTYADTGLTATITPSSASHKVLAIVSQAGVGKDGSTGVNLKLVRASTDILTFGSDAGNTNAADRNYIGTVSAAYLDEPATASAVAYKTQFASEGNVATAFVQLDRTPSPTSTLILMEVQP